MLCFFLCHYFIKSVAITHLNFYSVLWVIELMYKFECTSNNSNYLGNVNKQ